MTEASTSWREMRLEHLVRRVRRPVVVDPDGVYSEIGIRSYGNGIFHKEDISGTDVGSKDLFAISSGDLVFNIVFAWEGAVALADGGDDGRVGSFRFPTYRAVAGSCDIRFINYFFQTRYGRFLLREHSPGGAGRNRTLNQPALLKEKIAVPPLAVQRRIADQLDRQFSTATALVDAAQQSLGEARRMAFALTHRGLNQAAALKDSGVEPVGKIPVHWKVVRNKTVFREVSDLSCDGTEELLTVSHLTGVTPRSEKAVTMTEAESLVGYKRVKPGDLVINTLWAWMGALGFAKTEGIVSPAYGVYRPDRSRVCPEFFEMFLRSPTYVAEMTRHSRGVWRSRLRLYPESFLALSTILPPLAEQEQIAQRADTSRLYALVNEFDEAVHSYRQALVEHALIPGDRLTSEAASISTAQLGMFGEAR
jgi:type I restriction enzyme S subunit